MSDNSNPIPDEAVEYLRRSNDYDSMNRQEGMDDLRFSYGEQWSAQMQNDRHLESRPWFVINETDSYIRQICNQMRQQRPRIKAHGVNSQSDVKIAEIITGVTRHIEEQSDADHAYDIAGEFAVRMGWGYWRVGADYAHDDSFDQDIQIQPIWNPFTVSFDPHSHAPDGSDQTQCLISDRIQKKDFRILYPNADEANFSVRAVGDRSGEWLDKETIRIAEYYKINKKQERLYHLSDGKAWWADEMPDKGLLEQAGVQVIGDRLSWRKEVCWYKLTAHEVLDQRILPGRYIPVVPVYGANLTIDGRVRRFGVTRMAKDPQRMLNYWQTSVTELVALAAKAKWIMPADAVTGFERTWERANNVAFPYLLFNHKDDAGGEIPRPERQAPEPPPEGAMAAAAAAHENLQRVLGMFDPAMRTGGNMSGKALNAEQQQSDMSNYHFYDNLTRSIKHTGRIILDWLPTYYGSERVTRIIGDDGKSELVTLNKQAIDKIENDITVGEYDVVMETGPGYNSKRQEAVALMTPILSADPHLMQVAGDLFIRNMDFPGADVIADRLATMNPLAQIDDKSDVPPRAQMMIKQLQGQLRGAQQQLQQAGLLIKSRSDVEMAKEAAETHRLTIRESGEDRRAKMRADTEIQRESVEDAGWLRETMVKAHSAANVEEIKGIVQILLKHLDGQHADSAAKSAESTIKKAAE